MAKGINDQLIHTDSLCSRDCLCFIGKVGRESHGRLLGHDIMISRQHFIKKKTFERHMTRSGH